MKCRSEKLRFGDFLASVSQVGWKPPNSRMFQVATSRLRST